jgi:hypothetical protein
VATSQSPRAVFPGRLEVRLPQPNAGRASSVFFPEHHRQAMRNEPFRKALAVDLAMRNSSVVLIERKDGAADLASSHALGEGVSYIGAAGTQARRSAIAGLSGLGRIDIEEPYDRSADRERVAVDDGRRACEDLRLSSGDGLRGARG